MSQDRPSMSELLQAVREFLAHEAAPGLDGVPAFHARVAGNVLGILEREHALGPTADAAEARRLSALLGQEGPLNALNRELCRRLRAGDFDQDTEALILHLRAMVIDKLRIANPRYLEESGIRVTDLDQ